MELEALLEHAGFSGAQRLGAGGSGVVFRATHEHFGVVAVKVLVADATGDPKAKDRFAREAANLARVNHPALVPLLSAGDLATEAPYIVMPLLDGPTVAERLRNGGRLSLTVARAAFERIAGALAALHGEGILHRDVKPENVLLTSNGAMLLDLGIAKEDGAPGETTEGAVRGTPRTMAPERMFGAPATRQSDVYELALFLYTMLVGKVPWAHDADPLARLAPPPLTAARDDVPVALSDAILRALSTRPERRPATIDALVVLVREALEVRADEETETRTHAPSGTSARSGIRQSVAEATVIDVVTPAPFGKGAAPRLIPTAPRLRRWVAPALGFAGVVALSALGLHRWTSSPSPPERLETATKPPPPPPAVDPAPPPEPPKPEIAPPATAPVAAEVAPPRASASAHGVRRSTAPPPKPPPKPSGSRFTIDRQ